MMVSVDDLYDRAAREGVDVIDYPFESIRSMSVPGAIGMDMRQMESAAMEKTDLAHELGHEETGAFYTADVGLDDRGKCERKANKRAAEAMLMPFDEVVRAISDGNTQIWQLADVFGVTEQFVRTALDIYAERLHQALPEIHSVDVETIDISKDGNGGYNVPEMHMHISAGKSASLKDIRKAIGIIQSLRASEDYGSEDPA